MGLEWSLMLIEHHIEEHTGLKVCADAASEMLEKTSHLVRARSVAYGAGYCIFAARLAETMGAVVDLISTIPGKGILVHEILSVALPLIFYGDPEYRKYLFEGHITSDTAMYFVEKACEKLRDAGIIQYSSIESERLPDDAIERAKNEAAKMLHVLSAHMPMVTKTLGWDPERTRLYTELMLHSYRFHIVGTIDAIIEDPVMRKALVIEWKTGRTPQNWEIYQTYVYALLEAERLGYHDPVRAVGSEEYVIPVVIRPEGQIRFYCLAESMRTTSRRMNVNEILDKIILASEHLTLTITNPRKHVGRNQEEICKITSEAGRRVSAFRYTPKNLPRSNPKTNKGYPCNTCSYRDACLFYMVSSERSEYIDRLAWRSRFAIYDARENALKPLKEIYDLFKDLSFERADEMLNNILERLDYKLKESGNRVDVYEKALIDINSYSIVLERRIRGEEASTEPYRLKTVREGKPVLVIFRDAYITNPLMRLSFHGRVEEIKVEGGRVKLCVTAPNMASRIPIIVYSIIARRDPSVFRETIVIETNVDLTQLELQAVDAFQRSTRSLIKKLEGMRSANDLEELAERSLSTAKRLRDCALAVLFGEGFARIDEE